MYIIDSSVWVALFLDFDSNHSKAADIFSSINDRILLSYGVISEVVTVLTYKHSKKQADSFLSFISDNQDIVLMENQIVPEIKFFLKQSAKISFTDISLLYLAGKFKLILITFDKQLISLVKNKKHR